LLIDQLLHLGWLDVIDLIAEMAGEFGLALSGLDPWSLGQSRWPRSGLTAAPELAATLGIITGGVLSLFGPSVVDRAYELITGRKGG
jgi:hypothetical protein